MPIEQIQNGKNPGDIRRNILVLGPADFSRKIQKIIGNLNQGFSSRIRKISPCYSHVRIT